MNRIIRTCLGLLVLALLTSCSSQPTVVGLWQSTDEAGTLEFKATGEVTVVDNMSATMVGRFEIEDGNQMRIKWTASDILRESVEPISPIAVKVEFDLSGDELSLRFNGESATKTYRRIP